MNKDSKIGKSFPLGATVCPAAVDFSVFAKGGEAVQLLLFDHVDDAQQSRTITLDPVTNRSRHYWPAPGSKEFQERASWNDGPRKLHRIVLVACVCVLLSACAHLVNDFLPSGSRYSFYI
jgi:pullulanase/glycogen debranching enzyme